MKQSFIYYLLIPISVHSEDPYGFIPWIEDHQTFIGSPPIPESFSSPTESLHVLSQDIHTAAMPASGTQLSHGLYHNISGFSTHFTCEY